VVLIFPGRVNSHPEYAIQTSQPCAHCHVDPEGGGVLNSTGEAFRLRGYHWPIPTARAYFWQRFLRLTCGWLHLIAAVAWLGAILFVHLILSPHTVARGIPTRELVFSWVCIIILAITGFYLTVTKINSWSELTSTSFGKILIAKICIFLLMVSIASFITLFVNPRLKKHMGESDFNGEQRKFTLEELNTFDGREGKGIYVAIKGRVYDLSHSPLWKDGVHMKRHSAGKDLSEALLQSPHGEKPLEKFLPLGILSTGQGLPKAAFPYQGLFLFLAYFNLLSVLSILFCVALWRW
jgi:predicted heme/steroid binding protein